jgi:broad specificity phosphatase PhoE
VSRRLVDDTLGLADAREIGGGMGSLADVRCAAATTRDDARAFGGELPYDLEPDPGSGAGDEAAFAFEPEIHAPRLSRVPTTIVLVRHGETDWNRERRYQGHADTPLNEAGRRQAVELADALRDEGLTAVYTSPLRRAAETGDIVAQRLGLAAEELEALREIDVGDWQGLTVDEVKARFPEQVDVAWRSGWPNGETHDELSARVIPALIGLDRIHMGGHVLGVTHAGPIRVAIAAAAGLSHEESRAQIGPLANCALFRFAIRDGRLEAEEPS